MSDAELASGLTRLGLAVSAGVERKLLDYVELIAKWNKVYNLTAVRDPKEMVTLHVLDSAAVVPHITGSTLLDIGSGAGLPGIPVALLKPELEVTLLDSNQKKTSFQQQAAIELGLTNVRAVHARAEEWNPGTLFDIVISRAFSEIATFVAAAGRFCAPAGVLAAMKGIHPHEEIAAMPTAYRVNAVVPLHVPGLDAERHLVLMGHA